MKRKINIFSGLRTKIIILFTATAAVVLSGFSIWSYFQTYNETTARIDSQLSMNAETAVNEIDSWFRQRMISIETMSSYLGSPGILDIIIEAGTDDNIYLKPFIGQNGLDPYIGIKGRPPYYGGDFPEPPGYIVADRPWYKAANTAESTSFTDYYIDSQTKELTMTLVAPVLSRTGNIDAVIATDLLLSDLLEKLYTLDVGDASVIMMDQSGIILAHEIKELITQSAMDSPMKAVTQEMLEKKNGRAGFMLMDEPSIIVYRTIPSTGWIIGFFVDEKAAFASLGRLGWTYTGISVVVILLFFCISLIISVVITRKISFISDSLHEIAMGDGDLTVSVNLNSRDELGQLAANFNTFVEKIRTLVVQIKESSDATVEHKNVLASNTEEIGAAITEINANLNSMESQIRILNESAVKNSDSSETILTYIRQFDNQMDEQAAMVEQTSAAINEMTASLENISRTSESKRSVAQDLKNKAQTGGELLEKSNRAFSEGVVNRIQSIGEVIQLIKGITSQINLLSMNAAIEAAHAGDAGRGFSVVAEEVRKLAESSSESVKKIEATIKEINKAVKDTADATEETAHSFVDINKAVEEFTSALSEIAGSTSELLTGGKQIQDSSNILQDITADVKTGSSRIREQIEAINNGIEQIKNISQTVTSGILEAVTGSNEIVTASTLTADIVAELEDSTNKLKKEVGIFKT